MCDLHSQVLGEILVQPVQISPQPGHPLDTFKRENEALTEVVAEMRKAAADLATRSTGCVQPVLRHVVRRFAMEPDFRLAVERQRVL